MQLQMSGRNALVTGASKGIGLAISKTFLGAGANVAIVARNAEGLQAAKREIEKAGPGKIALLTGDVSKAEDCARVFAEAERL